ncbi:MAG: 30S ribosomal protein S21 [Candidatus Dojkabacteria bacterium]|jgi:ribosomal protein S21|uniref:Small ribosomal subunit protein bS21 n=2 Tax=Candidatus Dojkabacteria TaxID=74243 RepID=A0A1F4UKD4_9BACT|nr:30S ribosomal protein S21 [Candidatus Dojkabacteria bacterium]OGC45322.1 MAG: 30S ribosomal protein S21 [candidate division WS6 bacterium RIFOXYB1_FULL_33_14]OGC46492.1 MAG: 30S ribosomal protein S21 [candidate division WS6 bacterium RIFOXYC1_FULL_33_10]
MAVIVHANENIDSALKRLHREVMREKILETYREKVYRVKPSLLKIQKRREWAKMKRRRRSAARRAK